MTKIIEPKAIFISSTFRDMQTERDMLRDFVLPKVNEFAAQYGTHVDLIDLRWGVDTAGIDEREQSQKVLRTCLDEIERSRPFFIGLLGDRYGWVPPEREMKDALDFINYKAETTEQSVTALEIEYGALRSPKPPVCLFYFRHIEDYSPLEEEDIPVYKDTGEASEKLTALKARIKTKFGSSVKEYNAYVEDGEVAGLAGFAGMAAEDIISSLREQWGEPPGEPPGAEEKEIAIQNTFRASRTEDFVGREAAVQELREFCLGDGDLKVMLVTGGSGSGKSSLLCRVMDEIEDECLLLPVFCGLSSMSSKAGGILDMQLSILRKHLGAASVFIDGFSNIKQRYAKLLSEAAKGQRVVVVADGLEKLASRGDKRDISWLIGGLPDNFRLLCSANLDYDADNEIITSVAYAHGDSYEMPPMTDADITELIRKTAMRRHKQIPDAVAEHILKKTTDTGQPAAQNPLYVKLLIQDLAMLNRYEHTAIDKSFASMDDGTLMDAIILFMIKHIDETPPNAEQAFIAIINRIEKIIGEDFVFPVLGLIAGSRRGLREKDLEGTFSMMQEDYSSADFSWLRQMLPDMFVQGEMMQWNFAHENARLAIRSEFANHSESAIYGEYEFEICYNNWLIEHFLENLREDEFIRQEIMYHLYLSNNYKTAARLLCMAFEDGHDIQGYVDCLADIYIMQRDAGPVDRNFYQFMHIEAEEPDETDFSERILRHATALSDDNRWYAGMVYLHIVQNTLPFDAPVRYRIGLIETALEAADSVEDTESIDMDRYRIAAMYCTLLGDLYTEESKGSEDKAIAYYLRAVEIREIVYYGCSRTYDDLSEFTSALAKAVAVLYKNDNRRSSEQFTCCREQLAEFAGLCLDRSDEYDGESVYDYLSRLLDALTILSQTHEDDTYSGALDELIALAQEYVSKDESALGNYVFISALCKAWIQWGLLFEKAGRLDKAEKAYGASLRLSNNAHGKTLDDRFLALAVEALHSEANVRIRRENYEAAAEDYYFLSFWHAALFPHNPTISNAVNIFSICREYARICASVNRFETAARLAARQYLIARRICDIYSDTYGGSESYDITKANTYRRLFKRAEEMINKYLPQSGLLKEKGEDFDLIRDETELFKGALCWSTIDFGASPEAASAEPVKHSQPPEQRKQDEIEEIKALESTIDALIAGNKAVSAAEACYKLLSVSIKHFREFPGDDSLEIWDRAVDKDDLCDARFDLPYITDVSLDKLSDEYLSERRRILSLSMVRAFVAVIIAAGEKCARKGDAAEATATCNLALGAILCICAYTGYKEQTIKTLLKLWINRMELTERRLIDNGFKDAANTYTDILARARRNKPVLPEQDGGMGEGGKRLFTTLSKLLRES